MLGHFYMKDDNGNWVPIFKAETPDIQVTQSPTISVNGEVVAKLNVSDFCGEIALSDEAAAQLWATVEGGIEIVER